MVLSLEAPISTKALHVPGLETGFADLISRSFPSMGQMEAPPDYGGTGLDMVLSLYLSCTAGQSYPGDGHICLYSPAS